MASRPFLGIRWTSPAPPAILIEETTVLPMTSDTALPGRHVLIVGDRISAIDTAEPPNLPGGTIRVDGRGRFLMPGLIDMHVHLYDGLGFPNYLAHGVTTVVSMCGCLPATLALRDSVRRGSLVGPRIYTAGPSMNGYPAGNASHVAIETAADAKAEVVRQHRMGIDFIKVYSFLPPEAYEATIQTAREYGLAVVGHMPKQVDPRRTILGSQANIAHMEEIFRVFFKGDASDSAGAATLATLARASGITVTPNLFAYSEYVRMLDDIAGTARRPEARFASPAAFADKLPFNNLASGRPGDFRSRLLSTLDHMRYVTKALNDSGIPLMTGTDTELFGFAGESLHSELAELVQAGLTPYEALVAATRTPGTFIQSRIHRNAPPLGVAVRGGSADLVLLEADPRRDVGHAKRIAGVVNQGRWLDRSELLQMRAAVSGSTAPQRDAVEEFDRRVGEGQIDLAVRTLERAHQRWPTTLFLPENTFERYTQAAERRDPSAAQRLRRMRQTLYPTARAARSIAMDLLRSGDTAGATKALAQAHDRSPNDAWTRDLRARLEAKGHPPDPRLAGRWRLDTYLRTGERVDAARGILQLSAIAGGLKGHLSPRDSATGNVLQGEIAVTRAGGRVLWASVRHGRTMSELFLELLDDSVVVGRLGHGPGYTFRVEGRRLP
jgi:hypothetical protein